MSGWRENREMSRGRRCMRKRGFELGKGEICFIKDNMPRYENSSSDRIKAPIASVFSGIAKKNARNGSWR
jgi:hypothetical protein